MKKILVVLLLVSLSTSLFAKKVSMIQGTVMISERNYEFTGSDMYGDYTFEDQRDFTMYGLTLSRYKGGFLGWYSSLSVLAIDKILDQDIVYDDGTEYNNEDQEMTDTGTRLAGDLFLGPAMFIDLFLPGLIVGGGLHTNLMYVESTDESYDNSLSAVLGAGATVTGLVQLGPLNVNATINAYYDFLEYMNEGMGDGEFVPGTTVSVGVGVGLKI